GSYLIDGFSSAFSVRAMSVLAALLAITAVGQTLVILIGGIDLSIPFLIGFGNVVAAKLHGDGYPFELVVVVVLLLAGLIGAFSGGLSSSLKIHPLIVTLGVGTIVQGSVLLWTSGFPSGSAPRYVNNFVSIGATLGPYNILGIEVGPLPFPALIPFAFILAVLIVWILNRTVYGRQLYALGANPEAARLALVNPTRMWAITYALSAMFAAGAGILLLGFTGSAYAFVGNPYLFETISAVVIGGTSLLGGRGSYLGTFIGAFVLVELKTLLLGQGLTQALIQATLGVVILILVSIYGREEHIRNQI
ncbi:MAG: ABC transporter permease, partial [Burkholderiales bacterium]|nr:ABC transporter permease [Anaerolineae bacterium]